jgi:hypothetical protein
MYMYILYIIQTECMVRVYPFLSMFFLYLYNFVVFPEHLYGVCSVYGIRLVDPTIEISR